MCDYPNQFSSARSIFTGGIYFVKYVVRLSATKIDIFRKMPSTKKALFVKVGRV